MLGSKKKEMKYDTDDIAVILDMIKYNLYILAQSILYASGTKDPKEIRRVLASFDETNLTKGE